MSSRIDDRFVMLREEGRAGFIAYITAGDPAPACTVPLVLELERSGADIVELGVPFSDPLADGVVNQRAAERALKHGVSVKTVLSLVAEVRRKSEIPIVLFTYLNPLYRYGFEKFSRDAARAGVDGVLSLDLPPEESRGYRAALRRRGISGIFLIAPTTPPGRVNLIASLSEGFIYYVSRTGVTGESTRLTPDLARRLREIRRAARTPVAVGFGISTPAQVRAAAASADAVVVGSAIVREMESGGSRKNIVNRVGEKVRALTNELYGR